MTDIILLVAFAAVVSTLLGGLFARRCRDNLHLIIGFSAGAVMGIVFFDLIPESFELSSDGGSVPILMAAGFLIYMFMDRFFSIHSHDDDGCENEHHGRGIGASALVLHSLMDGVGVGLAFKVSSSVGVMVAIAVLAHDFSDGINTVAVMMRNRATERRVMMWLFLDAIAPAVGMVAATWMTVPRELLGTLMAVFCGLFLYLGASDLIPESHHRHPAIWTSVMTVVGMLMILVMVRVAGP